MKKKIVVIEDNLELRENISEILELDGFQVNVASNGKEGVELVQEVNPDLIVCDVMMPGLDGFGVLHLLAKDPETASIPFIFLTAKTDRSTMRRGMEMGADDFITKPFDGMELINAIESRLKKITLFAKPLGSKLNAFEELFTHSNDLKAFERLTKQYENKLFKKKNIIYLEGDWPRYLYYIKKGKIKTFKTNNDGKELILNIYPEDSFFGYLDLIKEGQMSDSAQAIDDSEVIMIPKSEFFSLMFSNNKVLRKLIEIISKDLKKQEDQLLKMAYNSVKKRIADALLQHIASFTKVPSTGYKISRENLASTAGTSLETCIRTLSEFKEEGYICIESGKIQVLDESALKNLNY